MATVRIVDRSKLGARGWALCAVAGIGGTLILRLLDALDLPVVLDLALAAILATALVAGAGRLIVRRGRPDIAIDVDEVPAVDAALRNQGADDLRPAITAGELGPDERDRFERVLRAERAAAGPDDAEVLAAVEERVAAAQRTERDTLVPPS